MSVHESVEHCSAACTLRYAYADCRSIGAELQQSTLCLVGMVTRFAQNTPLGSSAVRLVLLAGTVITLQNLAARLPYSSQLNQYLADINAIYGHYTMPVEGLLL
jgi:hypothetical protein